MNCRLWTGAQAWLRRVLPLAIAFPLTTGPCVPAGLSPDEQAALQGQLAQVAAQQVASVIGDLTFFLLDNAFVRLVN